MAKTYIDSKGYKRFSDSDILVHRWVAQEKIERSLKEGEEVHHKDKDKTNNHPSNIKVYNGKWGFLRHAIDHEAEKY